MYTMTIQDEAKVELVKGESLASETWEQTLLRLSAQSLLTGTQRLRIVYANHRSGRKGIATNTVVLGYEDDSGREVTGPTLLIHTDPPQF